jgi:hypothetical protein
MTILIAHHPVIITSVIKYEPFLDMVVAKPYNDKSRLEPREKDNSGIQ